jgi:prolyl oligopeptidase
MENYMTTSTVLKTAIALAVASLLIACQPKTEETNMAPKPAPIKVEYPETNKGDVVDTYFGQEVPDPYRWLEDDRSAETENWVKAQNMATQGYLQNIPYISQIADLLKEQLDYERISAPFKEGHYTYFYKNDGLQNQSVVYRQKEGSEPVEFLNPNQFSDDGTVSLAGLSFSNDGSLLAYQTSTGGSDWREVYIIDTNSMKQIGETLQKY